MVDSMTSVAGIFQIFLLTSCLYYSDSQTLHFCTDKNDGDPCLLTCKTSDVNQVISISKSPSHHISLGTCLVGGTCFPSDNSLYNVTQSGTNTYLEILSFGKSDNATWRCEYSGQTPHDKFLSWSKLPTSITDLLGLTSNVTIIADLTISVKVDCLYSLQEPTTRLQLMCGGALVTSHDMSCSPSSTVCSDSELSAYICNYTISSNPPSQTCISGYNGYSLRAVVSLDGTTKTYEQDIFAAYTVSFESTGGGGNGDGTMIVVIIVLIIFIIVVIIIIIIICCLLNKRCRSRYLRKDSKFIFTWPAKDIVVFDIHDKDFKIERPEGGKIEIQCLRTEEGFFMFDGIQINVMNGVKVRNSPFILLNPYIEIDDLKKEHEGLFNYMYGLKNRTGCSLRLEICNDIIISSKPLVYWAHEGEWLKLQLVETSVVGRWIKKNSKNGQETRIPSSPKKNSLVLKNINNEDAGSYIAANTSETWKSGCLTLKIVNSLVTVGKKDGSHVTIIKNSIKLKFTECKLSSIKLLKWRTSLLTDGTKISELESTSNYELILSEITKGHEGRYWCEVTNKNGTSTKSGILTLQVVHAIVNVGMKSASCSAAIGDSIQIRCTEENIPQQIIFNATRCGTNQIAPEPKITKITDTASLIIEKISQGDEGCYQFASADGDPISGVLTLSLMEGNERYNTLYLGQSKSGSHTLQTRNGAKTCLDSIPNKEDIQESTDKKKRKKGKKNKKRKEEDVVGLECQTACETTPEEKEIT